MQQVPKEFFKHKIVLFFGYIGKNYQGLQLQKDQNIQTIEKHLFQALIESQLIAPYNVDQIKKNNWSRGARTDKGVHALCNVVSAKICINEQYINKQKLLSLQNPASESKPQDQDQQQQTTNQIQGSQDITPSQKQNEQQQIQIESEDKNSTEYQNKMKEIRRNQKKLIDIDKIIATINSNLPDDIKVISIKEATKKFDVRRNCRGRIYEYYMPLFTFQNYDDYKANKPLTTEQEQQILARIREIIKKYKGSHNFHNYSRGQKAKDPSSQRFIIEISADIADCQDEQKRKFIKFTLFGQSFIYHQIRKMVGMVVQMFQNNLQNDFLDNTFFHNVVTVWLAPAEGLFLNQLKFDVYNRRGDIPEPLIFDKKEDERAAQFRKVIEQTIIETEAKQSAFSAWLELMKNPELAGQYESDADDKGGDDD